MAWRVVPPGDDCSGSGGITLEAFAASGVVRRDASARWPRLKRDSTWYNGPWNVLAAGKCSRSPTTQPPTVVFRTRERSPAHGQLYTNVYFPAGYSLAIPRAAIAFNEFLLRPTNTNFWVEISYYVPPTFDLRWGSACAAFCRPRPSQSMFLPSTHATRHRRLSSSSPGPEHWLWADAGDHLVLYTAGTIRMSMDADQRQKGAPRAALAGRRRKPGSSQRTPHAGRVSNGRHIPRRARYIQRKFYLMRRPCPRRQAARCSRMRTVHQRHQRMALVSRFGRSSAGRVGGARATTTVAWSLGRGVFLYALGGTGGKANYCNLAVANRGDAGLPPPNELGRRRTVRTRASTFYIPRHYSISAAATMSLSLHHLRPVVG
jgi:hypothetical protein